MPTMQIGGPVMMWGPVPVQEEVPEGGTPEWATPESGYPGGLEEAIEPGVEPEVETESESRTEPEPGLAVEPVSEVMTSPEPVDEEVRG